MVVSARGRFERYLPLDPDILGQPQCLLYSPIFPSRPPGYPKRPTGAFYEAPRKATVSPNPPAKNPPDENSHSAPGVLAAITLQVLAGQQGQPLRRETWVMATRGLPEASRLSSPGAASPAGGDISQKRDLGDASHGEGLQ